MNFTASEESNAPRATLTAWKLNVLQSLWFTVICDRTAGLLVEDEWSFPEMFGAADVVSMAPE